MSFYSLLDKPGLALTPRYYGVEEHWNFAPHAVALLWLHQPRRPPLALPAATTTGRERWNLNCGKTAGQLKKQSVAQQLLMDSQCKKPSRELRRITTDG